MSVCAFLYLHSFGVVFAPVVGRGVTVKMFLVLPAIP